MFDLVSTRLISLAVTLDGTIIHKSGNMTGGQGLGGDRKFDDRRVEGESLTQCWLT